MFTLKSGIDAYTKSRNPKIITSHKNLSEIRTQSKQIVNNIFIEPNKKIIMKDVSTSTEDLEKRVRERKILEAFTNNNAKRKNNELLNKLMCTTKNINYEIEDE